MGPFDLKACLKTTAHLAVTVDLPSLVYASLVVPLVFEEPVSSPRFWPLWVAKYHGFSVNVALTVIFLSVAKNLKKCAFDASRRFARFVAWQQNLLMPPLLPLNKTHEYYAYRVVFSGLVHALAHIFFTHRFRVEYEPQYLGDEITAEQLLEDRVTEFSELSLRRQARLFFASLWNDTHTWTGYALLLVAFLPLALTGLRLTRYLRRHFATLTGHRAFAGTAVALLAYHHPYYFWSTLWAGTFLADALLGAFAYTERCAVTRVYRFPNDLLEDPTQTNDVVDVTFAYPYEKTERLAPGDFVRVNVPDVSRWEWHDFTIMKNQVTNVALFDSNARITVRSVGKWTTELYRRVESGKTVMRVKGPYSFRAYDHFMTRLLMSRKLRFERPKPLGDEETGLGTTAKPGGRGDEPYDYEENENGSGGGGFRRWLCCCCSPNQRSLGSRVPNTLVMVCTGTAVTHLLGILDSLIPLYYQGYSETELPQRIVVCWIVRTVFNLNFAMIPMTRYQRILGERALPDLLYYEFCVTTLPNNSDALCAKVFRKMLVHAEMRETFGEGGGLGTRGRITAGGNGLRAGVYNAGFAGGGGYGDGDEDDPTYDGSGYDGYDGSGDAGEGNARNATLFDPMAHSLFMRNSRFSSIDPVAKANVSTKIGARLDYGEFARRYIRRDEHTVILLNTSVPGVQREFRNMARKYKCELVCDSLF